jgi:hypothetical protein
VVKAVVPGLEVVLHVVLQVQISQDHQVEGISNGAIVVVVVFEKSRIRNRTGVKSIVAQQARRSKTTIGSTKKRWADGSTISALEGRRRGSLSSRWRRSGGPPSPSVRDSDDGSEARGEHDKNTKDDPSSGGLVLSLLLSSSPPPNRPSIHHDDDGWKDLLVVTARNEKILLSCNGPLAGCAPPPKQFSRHHPYLTAIVRYRSLRKVSKVIHFSLD